MSDAGNQEEQTETLRAFTESEYKKIIVEGGGQDIPLARGLHRFRFFGVFDLTPIHESGLRCLRGRVFTDRATIDSWLTATQNGIYGSGQATQQRNSFQLEGILPERRSGNGLRELLSVAEHLLTWKRLKRRPRSPLEGCQTLS